MRSAGDEIHCEMLRQMRIPENHQNHVDHAYITSLKSIKTSDCMQNQEWNVTPVVVASNAEKSTTNKDCSKSWSKFQRTPRCV